MPNRLYIFMIITLMLLASGCSNRFWEDTKDTSADTFDYVFDTAPTSRPYHEVESIPIIEINHEAADVLYANVQGGELSSKSPIYYKSFKNLNNPSDTALFGRVVTQQIVDRLVQRGVLITNGDPDLQEHFLPQGVDPKKYDVVTQESVDKLPPRAAVLTGNYAIGDYYVYMTAKVVRLDDKAVVSGHNWVLPISDNVRQLLPQLALEGGLEPSVKTKFD